MNYKLVGAGLLALAVVATGAVAASPGNAPVDAPIDDRADQAENDSAPPGPGAAVDAGSEGARPAPADNVMEPGPPADLPSSVPDFVGDLHDLIGQHLDGTLNGLLGDHVSDVTPDEDPRSANETGA